MPICGLVSETSSIIRRATADDAVPWIDLLIAGLGADYVAREVYDPAWVADQLGPESRLETWIVEAGGRIEAAASILPPQWPKHSPICNLGRILLREESYENGAAHGLFDKLRTLATERGQSIVVRVPAADNRQQLILEQLGFVCTGYQPIKHLIGSRAAMLFYTRPARAHLGDRRPMSDSLAQVSELCTTVLLLMGVPPPSLIRDGVTGYPLAMADQKVQDATQADYRFCRSQLSQKNPAVEISGTFHLGFGLMRVEVERPTRALLLRSGGKVNAGLAYYFDEHDRCIRLVDAFCADEASIGGLIQHAQRIAQENFQAVYLEVDIVAGAPRMLKTAEQLGFVPVAYLPAFYEHNDRREDVVKMVKVNVPYAFEGGQFTTQAHTIAAVVDRNFEELKVGMAVVSLLRGLPIFSGLGDGELRKVARLFQQRLYRPGETIFHRNQPGEEAFVVMRGEVEIRLDDTSGPVATLGPGKILGELAFLEGVPRTAKAVATQASILLLLHRDSFTRLTAGEPHLGMVVMRNIASDLSAKLRQTNSSLAARRTILTSPPPR